MAGKTVLWGITREELREWFIENADKESVCLVECRRGRIQQGDRLSYMDVVYEALCFGWIDATLRRSDRGTHLQQLNKRKARTTWSELNKARCEHLERLGLMTQAGRRALAQAKPFEVLPEVEEAFRNNPLAARNFALFPPLYQRVRLDTIQIYVKSRPERFEKRLEKLIKNSEQNKMYGEWNDGGILY